ncbi:MAG: hypothetical protein ABL989_14410 [Gammaproteobacteria bacterium]
MDRVLRRLALVVLLAATGVIGGLLLEGSLTTAPSRPFGHTLAGHLVGWLALLATLAVLAYSWTKRVPRLRRWQPVAFKLHMAGGVLAPVMVLVHSGIHLHALVPVIATLAMLAVSLSGVIGKAVHFFAVRRLREERKDLATVGLTKEEIEDRLESLAAAAETFRVWQFLHAPVTVIFLAALGAHVAGALYFGGP